MAEDASASPYDPPMAEVVELDYAPPAPRTGQRWQLLFAWLAAATVLGGTLLIFFEVESVAISGPALATFGVVLLVLGLAQHSLWASLLGAAHVAVCLLFFGLVFLNSWSPRQAELPFQVMSVAYCIPTLSGTILLSLRPRPDIVLE